MTRATDDGGEDGARSVITGETGLAHAGAIVHNEGLNFFVSHVEFVRDAMRRELASERLPVRGTAQRLYTICPLPYLGVHAPRATLIGRPLGRALMGGRRVTSKYGN